MMAGKKATDLLSMAQRAGKVASGSFAANQAMETGRAVLLLVAEDASEATKRDMAMRAEKCQVPMIVCLTKEEMGHCLGRGDRAVAVLLDRGFSKALEERLRGAG